MLTRSNITSVIPRVMTQGGLDTTIKVHQAPRRKDVGNVFSRPMKEDSLMQFHIILFLEQSINIENPSNID